MKWSNVVILCALMVLVGCAGERPPQLGVTNGTLSACPDSPNCVSSQARDERHRIEPLATGDDPDVTYARLIDIVRRRPDATVIEQTETYLRVELRTTFFIDDAEFLLDREQRRIQVRSASRVGYSDLGLNRRRIEEIRSQLQRRDENR